MIEQRQHHNDNTATATSLHGELTHRTDRGVDSFAPEEESFYQMYLVVIRT